MFGHDLFHRTQLTPNFFFFFSDETWRINTPTTLPTRTSDPLNFSCAWERVENKQMNKNELNKHMTHYRRDFWK